MGKLIMFVFLLILCSIVDFSLILFFKNDCISPEWLTQLINMKLEVEHCFFLSFLTSYYPEVGFPSQGRLSEVNVGVGCWF